MRTLFFLIIASTLSTAFAEREIADNSLALNAISIEVIDKGNGSDEVAVSLFNSVIAAEFSQGRVVSYSSKKTGVESNYKACVQFKTPNDQNRVFKLLNRAKGESDSSSYLEKSSGPKCR